MPELLLELFSEEIPARMQARGAEELSRVVGAALAPVLEGTPRSFHGPRRIGLVATLRSSVATEGKEERGPRIGAPQAALDGFLRKHGATQDQLAQQNGFWVLNKPGETVAARDLVARAMPGVIGGFSWPKSMRWNGPFTWVRPLHRVLCILDGEVVPFTVPDLPGVASGNETEGHRIMAPGAVTVFSFASYEAELRHRRVILDAAERMAVIEAGLAKLAEARGVRVVPDRGLLEEVAGLVEWPVPLLGRIDDAFMDLPPEVMRTTMRVNQRYFATVKPDGSAAPFFGVVANIAASDGGAVLVAGNERVLRARLSDARFFWDQDLKTPLEGFLPKLDGVVFHAKLGTQGQRVFRLVRLAGVIAPLVGADKALAERAALLCKADLAGGMVGEFPELQGVMGRYYARHHGEDPRVAEAIGAHYRPLGPGDAVPNEPVAIAVALADKLDTLAGFFAVGEKPTGSGDPFALRRAALGILRLIRENHIRLRLKPVFAEVIRVLFEGFSRLERDSLMKLLDALTTLDEPPVGEAIATLQRSRLRPLFEADGSLSTLRLLSDRSTTDALDRNWDNGALVWAAALSGPPVIFADKQPSELREMSMADLTAWKLRQPRTTPEPLSSVEALERLGDRYYSDAVFRLMDLVGIPTADELLDFLIERLRVQLRAEGARHDVIAAALTVGEDDLLRLLARADALKALVESDTGTNLLAAYKRAANILRIETKKDGPHDGAVAADLLTAPEEQALAAALDTAEPAARDALAREDFAGAMAALASLRAPLDAFFDRVTVNDPDTALRANRLRLLNRLRGAMDAVADFSKIEG